MKQFHFKYGEGGVDLALPETGRLQVLTGHAEEPSFGGGGVPGGAAGGSRSGMWRRRSMPRWTPR